MYLVRRIKKRASFLERKLPKDKFAMIHYCKLHNEDQALSKEFMACGCKSTGENITYQKIIVMKWKYYV